MSDNDNRPVSGVLGAMMLVYLGVGAFTIGAMLLPVAAAVLAFLAAHKVSIATSVVVGVIRAVKNGAEPTKAIADAGVEGAAAEVLLAALKKVGIADAG